MFNCSYFLILLASTAFSICSIAFFTVASGCPKIHSHESFSSRTKCEIPHSILRLPFAQRNSVIPFRSCQAFCNRAISYMWLQAEQELFQVYDPCSNSEHIRHCLSIYFISSSSHIMAFRICSHGGNIAKDISISDMQAVYSLVKVFSQDRIGNYDR